METVATIKSNLAHAIGTERYIKHFTGAFVFTDGVHQLREDADAGWLLDLIASYRRKEVFQLWELTVNDNHTAVLTMQEDTGMPYLVEKKYITPIFLCLILSFT